MEFRVALADDDLEVFNLFDAIPQAFFQTIAKSLALLLAVRQLHGELLIIIIRAPPASRRC